MTVQEEHVLGESNPKTRKTLVSLVSFAGVVAEIGIMGLGRPLLQRISKDWLLLISLMSSFIRIGSYALTPENQDEYYWFLLAIETFVRGVGTGCLQIAAVDRANELAGPLLQSTAQGLFSSSFDGLSGFLGLVGTGLVVRHTGNIRYAFWVCTGITGVTLSILVPYFIWKRSKERKTDRPVTSMSKHEK